MLLQLEADAACPLPLTTVATSVGSLGSLALGLVVHTSLERPSSTISSTTMSTRRSQHGVVVQRGATTMAVTPPSSILVWALDNMRGGGKA